MNYELHGESIDSYDKWKAVYKEHDSRHWRLGKSAESLAWFIEECNGLNVIKDKTNEALRQANIDDEVLSFTFGEIEHASRIDDANNQRKQDLALKGTTQKGAKFFIGIEAKVQETFGSKIKDAIKQAQKYKREHKNSKSVAEKRIKDLVDKYLDCTHNEAGELRYQPLHTLAGTANETGDINIMIATSFNTKQFKSRKKNESDFNDFMRKVRGIKHIIGSLYKLELENGKKLIAFYDHEEIPKHE